MTINMLAGFGKKLCRHARSSLVRMSWTTGEHRAGCSKRPDFSPAQPWRAETRLVPSKAAASYTFIRGGWNDPNCAPTFSPAHPLARRDVPFAREGLRLLMPLLQGSGLCCPLLRASNEHRFTVRVLRARRAPGRSLLILLRPRVA